ncbi:saccharopine dehydrogenase [Helicobacter pullorum]|uniref:saccharopine dehydrogenase family protein n=1 Tax=Helicobacter pullorum TaxID=35818 RepID=UPI0008168336|nr:saccharopine dehydrogenase family protein [Helicobacter pullorum]OCR05146.1 saccharopine dehydrogenase [Helicobacter pullorum]
MACVLQIGAGGVGGVVAHKMAMNRDVFSRIILASRNIAKCAAIADSIRSKGLGEIEIDRVDADNVDEIVALIEKYKPFLVVNVALPYQDLSIMQACLQTKTHYLDTANYEHPDSAHFEYKEQWAYDTRYKQAGIFALLGSGFDPGVTNVFCAYAQKHYFDEIHTIDILDCNAGDHGYAFATNFNPEINLREVSSKARFWVKDKDLALNSDLRKDIIYRKFEREEKHFALESNTQDLKNESYFGGQWRDVAPLALMKEWEYPEVGVKNSYLLYHEELESLIRNIKGLKRIRFFMTFGESYLTHMKCLENVGLLRVDEVEHNGQKIVPIQVLKTLLPDPASLAPRTKGQTHIGCYIKGVKDGKEKTIYIYNICEHEACYKEVNAQGVSYTTGVPAMIGAKLICEGKWGVGSNSSLTQDTRIAESSYAQERLALNADMPQGGEYQGIDNATELQNLARTNGYSQSGNAAGLSMNFEGCQARGEGSLVSLNDQAECDDSLKSRDKTTQGAGVWNMEQNDPDPFMRELNKQGLPYVVLEIDSNGDSKVLEDGRK